jgi:hypothetical protein
MAFSWSIDGDHETGNTRKRPEGARPIWLLALGLPLRRSSEPPFRDTLYLSIENLDDIGFFILLFRKPFYDTLSRSPPRLSMRAC